MRAEATAAAAVARLATRRFRVDAAIQGLAFAPDGKTIAVRGNRTINVGGNGGVWLLDAVSGKQLRCVDASDAPNPYIAFSPDGRSFASILLHTAGQKIIATGLTFHPNDKWIAVITRRYPENQRGGNADPRDFPQPRILLIEAVTGAIRETLIAPHGFSGSACFSPDGRTLATDEHGRVLLWDMTKMPALSSR